MRLVVPPVWFAVALALALAPAAASAAPGDTGFAFLKLGVGARAMGLGSAYVALADDPTAIYWNAAGLASIKNTQVTAMHNEWIQDFRQEFAAVGAHAGPGALGVSFSGFYTSEFEQRDDVGNLTGHFGFHDLALTGGYGLRVTKGLDAGVALRYVNEMIDEVNANALLGDIGVRYALQNTGVSFGAAAQNLGPSTAKFPSTAQYNTTEFPLPRTIRVGGAFSREIPALSGRGTLTAQYSKARDDDAHFGIGAEYSYHDHLALRAGGKFGYDAEKVSFGVGVMKDWFRFDYALVPTSEDLGTTHFFSVSGAF